MSTDRSKVEAARREAVRVWLSGCHEKCPWCAYDLIGAAPRDEDAPDEVCCPECGRTSVFLGGLVRHRGAAQQAPDQFRKADKTLVVVATLLISIFAAGLILAAMVL
ncbi:MAG: hypothetical protein AAF995_02640 [Planctomycetota bacterium]